MKKIDIESLLEGQDDNSALWFCVNNLERVLNDYGHEVGYELHLDMSDTIKLLEMLKKKQK